MTLRQIAREAATGALATAPVDECHAIADAVAVAVLRAVEAEVDRRIAAGILNVPEELKPMIGAMLASLTTEPK